MQQNIREKVVPKFLSITKSSFENICDHELAQVLVNFMLQYKTAVKVII